MRSFPSAARQRVAASVVGLVSLATLAVPLAHAADDDDLKKKQREVEGRIDDASADLDEASRQASRASRALEQAQAELGAARTQLQGVRTRLQAARERDAQLKLELAQAEADLAQATADLAAGRQAVEDQRAVVRAGVLNTYTQGDPDLRAMGSFFDNASLDDISDQQLADEVIVGKQTNAFDELAEIEEQLVDERAEVERTAEAVEAKRIEAADHLESMRTLYGEAAAAKERVEGLVAGARTARQNAVVARARDRQILENLKDREADIKEKLLALARKSRGKAGYSGKSDGYLSYPTNGSVTSPYGYRTHPIYGYYSLHNGTDFGVACGQSLYASASGTVIDTYYDSVYGNRVFLAIGNVNGKNLVLIYNHLTSDNVSEGQRVGRGDVVGFAGSTGWSTGCHLHFTVMANGTAVDPMNYL